jgi:ADP-heptose:LPS heptosyltransferase
MRGNKTNKRMDALVGQAAIRALAPFSRRGRGASIGPDREFRRILAIKLAAIGDTVLLVPALRELRRRWPGAEIGFLGTAVNRDLIGEFPQYVNRFFELDVSRARRDPLYLPRFVRELAAGGWEVGIDFDPWINLTPVLLRLSGAPVRVGFRTPSRVRHRLYTHTEPRERDSHESVNFLRLLRPLGIEPPAPVLELPVDRTLLPEVRATWKRAGWNGTDPVLLIHPGCGHAHPRAWPLPRYRELCQRLAGSRTSPFFVFTGAGSERALAEVLAAEHPGRSLAVCDAPLRELDAHLASADVVLSGNTGIMHLAAALGRPQVVLDGPNDAAKWGAINDRAVEVRSTCPECPCLDLGFEFHRTDGFCMEQIPVDTVFSAVMDRLDEVAPPRFAAAVARPRRVASS